jgi:hypothetical protein
MDKGDKDMTKQYRIPKRFIEDHDSRDCLRDANNEIINVDAVIVRTNKKHYIVALTDAQAAELLSDANHYKDLAGWDGMSLVVSAQATYNALIKQGMQPITKCFKFIY